MYSLSKGKTDAKTIIAPKDRVAFYLADEWFGEGEGTFPFDFCTTCFSYDHNPNLPFYFQSIINQPEYKTHTLEELRMQAYFQGRIFAGTPRSLVIPHNSGTRIHPFEEIYTKDYFTSNIVFYQSITCMPQYIGKSIEELRMEDYRQSLNFAYERPAFGYAMSKFRPTLFCSPLYSKEKSLFLASQSAFGTQIYPFKEMHAKDSCTFKTVSYQSITFMPQYKGKSIEELRMQDYHQGFIFGSEGPETCSFSALDPFKLRNPPCFSEVDNIAPNAHRAVASTCDRDLYLMGFFILVLGTNIQISDDPNNSTIQSSRAFGDSFHALNAAGNAVLPGLNMQSSARIRECWKPISDQFSGALCQVKYSTKTNLITLQSTHNFATFEPTSNSILPNPQFSSYASRMATQPPKPSAAGLNPYGDILLFEEILKENPELLAPKYEKKDQPPFED